MCVVCMLMLYVLVVYVFSDVRYGGEQARPDIPPCNGRDSKPMLSWDSL